MSNRTLHITHGVMINTARWSLKMELEAFGKVEACHMGNRDDPKEQPPWVKFASRDAAERALKEILSGRLFVNGYKLKAEWRRDPNPPSTGDNTTRTDLDYTSRDYFLQQGGKINNDDRPRRRRSGSRRRDRGDRGDRERRGRRRDRGDDYRDDHLPLRDREALAIRDVEPLALCDGAPDERGGRSRSRPRRIQETRVGCCGHLVESVQVGDKDKGHSVITQLECDFCGALGKGGLLMFGCEDCGYDMCRNCADKADCELLT